MDRIGRGEWIIIVSFLKLSHTYTLWHPVDLYLEDIPRTKKFRDGTNDDSSIVATRTSSVGACGFLVFRSTVFTHAGTVVHLTSCSLVSIVTGTCGLSWIDGEEFNMIARGGGGHHIVCMCK